MNNDTPLITSDLAGHVVEFFRLPASVRTGIVGNLPKERHIARVSHKRDAQGSQWCAYNADGGIVILNIEDITADLGPARAGWGSW